MGRPAVIFGTVVHAAPHTLSSFALLKSFPAWHCGGFVLLSRASFQISRRRRKTCVNTKEAERIFTTCVNPAHVPKYPPPTPPFFFLVIFEQRGRSLHCANFSQHFLLGKQMSYTLLCPPAPLQPPRTNPLILGSIFPPLLTSFQLNLPADQSLNEAATRPPSRHPSPTTLPSPPLDSASRVLKLTPGVCFSPLSVNKV